MSGPASIEEVNATFARQYLDVESTSGDELVCLCPFHGDTHPSFWYNTTKGLYVCFACGAKGNNAMLAAHFNAKLDVPRALLEHDWEKELAEELAEARALEHTPTVGNGLLVRPESDLLRFQQDCLHPYWTEVRGFSAASCELHELGYDPITDRVTIPMRSIGGQYLGVIKRAITDDNVPKYKYPSKVPVSKLLYGAHLAVTHRRIVLVEGSLDAIRCWSYGVPAVAILGSSASTDQIRLLDRIGADEYVIMTDRDKAGRKLEAQLMASLGRKATKAAWSPEEEADGSDPDSLSEERLHVATGIARQLA